MAKKIRISIVPKKTLSKPKKVNLNKFDKEEQILKKMKLYKPKVRLTAHIKKKIKC